MPKPTSPATETTIVLDAESMDAHLRRMAAEVIEAQPDLSALVLLGILRRGKPLADRLAQHIGLLSGTTPPVGQLATTLYRDDLQHGNVVSQLKGDTYFNFSLDDRTVLIVDDVLAAGRTIRAALDEVMDYGRPKRIQLACLVDRGGRELPIQADYLGWPLPTQPHEWVSVRLAEMDGEDAVLLERHEPSPGREGA